MKKLTKLLMMVMVFTLSLLGAQGALAATLIDQQTNAKITQAYYYTATNDIALKIPNTTEFSSGKPVWQVQNSDGTWSDIAYLKNPVYFAGCSYGLGIRNFTQSIGQTYRLKMINSTLNTNYYTVPYTLTQLTAPAYSSYLQLHTY